MSLILFHLALLLSSLRLVLVMAQGQTNLRSVDGQSRQWSITLSTDWDVLGPFPIHAREQQFLSPSYPINLSQPINFQDTWPSSYADNVIVRWSKTQLSEDGIITVAFPEVRWKSLRATEGWAALQHHAVLRGTMTLIPPDVIDPKATIPKVLVQLEQGSYFTILPMDGPERGALTPEWYAGNIYNMERALPRVVDLPTTPDPTNPTQYEIFISGDYEIRLFGDPHVMNTEIPTQVISLFVQVDSNQTVVQHESSQDVLCDFVDGLAFGETIGIGMRSPTWSTVTRVASQHPDVELILKQSTRIAPSQLRIVPLEISQHGVFHGSSLDIVITATHGSGQEVQIPISLPITQRSSAEASNHVAFKATYLYGSTMPTAFLAIPPVTRPQKSSPPILVLHGAGVDIITQSFWPEALPPNNLSWTVSPSGRTSWGLDWHGPSAQDAWNCVDALASILEQYSQWKDVAFKAGTPAVIIGHSNGGQGTWYVGLRHPDRVLGLVPAAGYIKSQGYVPLTMSRSAHFIDPLLRAILETSLTPDDNDLFLTNIVNKPVLVVHGGDDNNVPVWHGREHFSIVESWNRILGIAPDITMKEDKGQLHFYPTVLNNSQVQGFINGLLEAPRSRAEWLQPFTLTVFRPEESGSLHSWKIQEVKVPGRLARLTAIPSRVTHVIEVRTTNVRMFTISHLAGAFSTLRIDGDDVILNLAVQRQPLQLQRDDSSLKWKLLGTDPLNLTPSPPTRIQYFLSSNGPITFVQPSSNHDQAKNFNTLALRLAHDLHIYHRLDSEIIRDHELISGADVDWPKGNTVLMGTLSDPLIKHVLSQGKTPLAIQGNRLSLNGHTVRSGPHTGLVFLHPHPTSPDALIMFVIGESPKALEWAARLFPIRTGITVPSWVILGPGMDEIGAAGISAAGVWGHAWSWNNALSWSEFF